MTEADSRFARFRAGISTPFSREQFLSATLLNAGRQLLVAVGIALQTRALRFVAPAPSAVWLVYLTTFSAGMIFEFGVSAMVLRELGWGAGRSAREGQPHLSVERQFLSRGSAINRLSSTAAFIVCGAAMCWYVVAVRNAPAMTPLFAVLVGVSFGCTSALQMRSFFLQSVIGGLGVPMAAVGVRLVSVVIAHTASIVSIVTTRSVLPAIIIWPLVSSIEVMLLRRVIVRSEPIDRVSPFEAWRALRDRISGAIGFALTGGFSSLTLASIPYFVGLGTGPAGVRAYTTAVLASQGIQALINQGISSYIGRVAYLTESRREGIAHTVHRDLTIAAFAVATLQLAAALVARMVAGWMNEGTGVLPGLNLIVIASIAFAADSIGHYGRTMVWCFGRWPFLKYYVIQFVVFVTLVGVRISRTSVGEILALWAVCAVALTLVPTLVVLFRTIETTPVDVAIFTNNRLGSSTISNETSEPSDSPLRNPKNEER
jgi:hypothetical protein